MRGAQRDPDPELARALTDQISHDPVSSNRRQGKSHTSEKRQQQHGESTPYQRFVNPLLHGTHVVQWQIAVKLLDLLFDGGG